ncbi:hypothetical protein HFV04_016735 [Pseudomonas sp. BIGb0427]|uniref:hypothetical protein n=1 Tax=Pseudomonas sp. BIGb0427 TaxID=2724470 RepID=UPI0018A7C2AB|nr:hypothetical protein [Pseudomonas sp. BIGb0427]QPG61174.1 hypothetical protein HFV04_016735 [Pseudomonas sp. BIGb0427]
MKSTEYKEVMITRAVSKCLMAVSIFGIYSATAGADEAEQSVNNAFALCKMLDSTGQLTEPCEVSGWGSRVDISLDASASQAKTLCPAVKGMLARNEMVFGPGWTLKISSPYSGDKAIATCQL